jgi:hypothetical protein
MRQRAIGGCLKDNLIRVIIVATLIIVAAIFAGSPYNETRNDRAKDGAYPAAYNEKPPKTFWEKTTNDPVATFTAVLALFTVVLAVVSIVQIYFLTRADLNARISAKASLRATKIAAA